MIYINYSRAFTLLEILISLLILGGTLGIFFTSLQVIEKIKQSVKLELEAYLIAERELELVHSELNKTSFQNLYNKNLKLKPKFYIPKFRTEINLQKKNKLDNLYEIKVKVYSLEKSALATLQKYVFLKKN